jgi:hypothetical protein
VDAAIGITGRGRAIAKDRERVGDHPQLSFDRRARWATGCSTTAATGHDGHDQPLASAGRTTAVLPSGTGAKRDVRDCSPPRGMDGGAITFRVRTNAVGALQTSARRFHA